MAKFNVKVTVEYDFPVEASSEEQAEQEGWNYEEYAMYASVYSIDVEEEEEEDEDEE